MRRRSITPALFVESISKVFDMDLDDTSGLVSDYFFRASTIIKHHYSRGPSSSRVLLHQQTPSSSFLLQVVHDTRHFEVSFGDGYLLEQSCRLEEAPPVTLKSHRRAQNLEHDNMSQLATDQPRHLYSTFVDLFVMACSSLSATNKEP